MSSTEFTLLPQGLEHHRILNSSQAAAFWGVSLPHWRRLYKASRVPSPIHISERKLGWRAVDLIEALESRSRLSGQVGR